MLRIAKAWKIIWQSHRELLLNEYRNSSLHFEMRIDHQNQGELVMLNS